MGIKRFELERGIDSIRVGGSKKPQIKAPRVALLEGAFTYGFAIRVYDSSGHYADEHGFCRICVDLRKSAVK